MNILATVVQDLCLIGAAILMARHRGDAAAVGLRAAPDARSGPPSAGSPLLLVGVLPVHGGRGSRSIGADNTEETLPKELGAEDSDVALVSVALLVCVLAPLAEEFFFRGYFFTALRSWRGMWPAALITGLVFGGIHAGSSDPAFLSRSRRSARASASST